ncbi:hypothetical protein F441_14647, partial [Phytophthora nicotianae CJ01A1]
NWMRLRAIAVWNLRRLKTLSLWSWKRKPNTLRVRRKLEPALSTKSFRRTSVSFAMLKLAKLSPWMADFSGVS